MTQGAHARTEPPPVLALAVSSEAPATAVLDHSSDPTIGEAHRALLALGVQISEGGIRKARALERYRDAKGVWRVRASSIEFYAKRGHLRVIDTESIESKSWRHFRAGGTPEELIADQGFPSVIVLGAWREFSRLRADPLVAERKNAAKKKQREERAAALAESEHYSAVVTARREANRQPIAKAEALCACSDCGRTIDEQQEAVDRDLAANGSESLTASCGTCGAVYG